MSIFVVAYPIFGHSDGQEIERFRQLYAPGSAKLISAHMTVVFAVTTFSYDVVLDRAKEKLQEVQPFEVLLNQVVPYADQFSDERMLFLVSDKSAHQMINFHQRFYDGRFATAMQVDEAYQPHLTIARTTEPDQFVKAQAAAVSFKLPIYASISAFNVIEIGDSKITRSTEIAL